MVRRGVVGVVLWSVVGLAAAGHPPGEHLAGQAASVETHQLAAWVLGSHDHEGRPFAIVDKKNAQIYMFDGGGLLRGVSAVLLGQAPGDHNAAGVGEHAQAGNVPLHERTTPAGRFVTEPGRNLRGEHVVWVDYESAFAIHPVRPGTSRRHREARLASPTARDNRASWGCVVVPVGFYKNVVTRYLGQGSGLVYVLPENRPAREVFSAL
jgi:hypothetical protein